MKYTKALLAAVGALGAAAFLHAPSASAEPILVSDEAAGICNSLSLVDSGYSDFGNLQISMLQLQYDESRAYVVGVIRQAATDYCPEYLSSVPAR